MRGSGCGARVSSGLPQLGLSLCLTCRLQSDPGILAPPLYSGSLERRASEAPLALTGRGLGPSRAPETGRGGSRSLQAPLPRKNGSSVWVGE